MRALTRFFSENGVILPNGASACLSMPMGRSDAEFIVDVFGGFLDTHAGLLDEIEGGK